MSSSTSNSRRFLAAFAVAMLAAVVSVTLADERGIHTDREYAMSRAVQDRIETACEAGHVGLAVFGDSRAVASIDDVALRAQGYDAWKFAVGGAGPVYSVYVMEALEACGARVDAALLSYGAVDIFEPGAIIAMGVNHDFFKGPAARKTFGLLSQIEDRRSRRIAYRVMSAFGTKLTLLDFILLRPGLKRVLLEPGRLGENARVFDESYVEFTASGTAFYGEAPAARRPPEELGFDLTHIPEAVTGAVERFAALAEQDGTRVYFFHQPMNDIGYEAMPPYALDALDGFNAFLRDRQITVLNDFHGLPTDHFGDPSHVNPRGRAAVMEELLDAFAAAGLQPPSPAPS